MKQLCHKGRRPYSKLYTLRADPARCGNGEMDVGVLKPLPENRRAANLPWLDREGWMRRREFIAALRGSVADGGAGATASDASSWIYSQLVAARLFLTNGSCVWPRSERNRIR